MKILNEIKKALDKGEVNERIVNDHYDILDKADMDDAQRKRARIEDELYTHEISSFVNVDGSYDHNATVATINDNIAYDGELLNYVGNKITGTIVHSQEMVEEYEKQRKKKELIELNIEHIKLLVADNLALQAKINKNGELINYLKNEIGI